MRRIKPKALFTWLLIPKNLAERRLCEKAQNACERSAGRIGRKCKRRQTCPQPSTVGKALLLLSFEPYMGEMASGRPTIVILHGAPAAGKLTIGKELAKISAMKLFHNHLVVDALLALFPFGSPNFVKYREKIWMDVMRDAVREGASFIFTFSPESTVSESFMEDLGRSLEEEGARVIFIEITCSTSVLKDRMGSESRHKNQKLTSFEFFEQLREEGHMKYPAIPVHFSVDSATMSPEESAQSIEQFLSKE